MHLQLGCLVAAGACAHGQIAVSTFDVDADGWQAWSGDGGFYEVDWIADGGNPGGYIEEVDPDNGATYFWAPDKFTGDQSAAFGGMLSYDISHSGNGTESDAFDIIMWGAGPTLVWDMTPPPVDVWTTVEIPLDESGGWMFSNGDPASDADIMAALAGLEDLAILGEFLTNIDTHRIDNVILTPAPGAASMVAAGLLFCARRRR